jgi:hypothetical protein
MRSEMTSYIIYMENELGQKGYHGMITLDGEYTVLPAPDNAVRFETEDDAEAAVLEFPDQQREEARIDLIATDTTAELKLGGRYRDDGISVVEINGGRYMVACNAGFEASEAIPDEVADALVPILLKIKARLASTKGSKEDAP